MNVTIEPRAIVNGRLTALVRAAGMPVKTIEVPTHVGADQVCLQAALEDAARRAILDESTGAQVDRYLAKLGTWSIEIPDPPAPPVAEFRGDVLRVKVQPGTVRVLVRLDDAREIPLTPNKYGIAETTAAGATVVELRACCALGQHAAVGVTVRRTV